MTQRLVQRRVLGVWLTLAAALLSVSLATAQVYSVDAFRRAAAYAEQMRPAGLAALHPPVQATLEKLQRAPEVQRALTLSALDEPDTLPFHVQATFTLAGDLGPRTGTMQADRYNDRWSRLTVALGDKQAAQWVLDGRRVTDDRFLAIPFSLQRLLRAFLSPLSDLTTTKVPMLTDSAAQDGMQLRCTVFGRQPPLDLGLVSASRSVCIDPATGDLRLDVDGAGFRTIYSNVRPLGNRRIASQIDIYQGNTLVAELKLAARVAGELTPASFAEDQRHVATPPSAPPIHFCWMTKPWQMRGELETVDAHLLPLGEEALRQHAPMVVARVLTGTDGRLADVEMLGDTDPQLRERALRLLRASNFKRHEWKGQPVSVEGLLLLGAP